MHERFLKAAVAVRSYVSTASLPLLLVQLLAFGALLVGISFWSVPAALVVGGVLAIIACEMQSRGPSEDQNEVALAERNLAIKANVDEALKNGKNPFTVNACPMLPMWVQYVDAVTRSVPVPKTDR